MPKVEIVGIEVIKKVRPELKGYKFIPAESSNSAVRIPFTYAGGLGAVTIYLNEKIKDGSDIIKFGIDDEYKIVVFKVIDECS